MLLTLCVHLVKEMSAHATSQDLCGTISLLAFPWKAKNHLLCEFCSIKEVSPKVQVKTKSIADSETTAMLIIGYPLPLVRICAHINAIQCFQMWIM